MKISRRHLLKGAGASLAFAAAPAWMPRTVWAREVAAGSADATPCFLHSASNYAPLTQHFLDLIDPGKDEFITEQYAAELEAVLGEWSHALQTGSAGLQVLGERMSSTLHASTTDESVATALRPEAPIRSERVLFGAPQATSAVRFGHAFERYLATLGSVEVVDFRLSGIEVAGESPLQVRTEVTYLLTGRQADGGRAQRTGAWRLDWKRDEGAAWKLTAWVFGAERRCALAGKGFVDVTEAYLGRTTSLHEQLDHGVDYWRTVLDGAYGVDIYGNNGISVGDFDGDGRDDVYVCQPAGIPNRLYRNRGDGTFQDVTEASGVGVLDATSSAIFADFRNTGRQDLLVVRTAGPLLFLNGGDGTFQMKEDAFQFAKPPQGSFTSVGVADYNRDGLLDIYFCLYSYYQGLSDYQFPTPYYDAQNGPPNFLFRNRGDGSFEDVTVASGMNVHNDRYTLACSWNDYNQDGWPDLYVVNDFGRKILYRNNGDGTFTDVSAAEQVEDAGEGMSSTWFDADNDGKDELYAVNMWEAAGKRVTSQKQFMPTVADEIRQVYRQDARGNTLLKQDAAKGSFQDVSETAGTRVSGWNWSSGAWDIDQDGFQELYVVNGFITGHGGKDVSSFYWRQVAARSMEMGGRSRMYEEAWSTINEAIRSDCTWSGLQRNNLFLNNRDGSFAESASLLGLDCLEDGRAFALADLDGDGRLEVLVKNRNAPQLRVFHNQLELAAGAIAFSLRGTKSNRDAIGAVVELKTANGMQRRVVTAGEGFLSQHSKVATFGLGANPGPIQATVRWPSGTVQHFENLPAGHRIELREGTAAFEAKPFRAAPVHAEEKRPPGRDDLDAVSASWLVEPIRLPSFTLPYVAPAAVRGKRFDLATLTRPALLVFWQPGCTGGTALLRGLAEAVPEWRRRGLDLIVVLADEAKPGPEILGLPFPVLVADERTSAVYNLFFRYLHERRRAMPMPTAFLVNAKRQAIKVYRGGFTPAAVLADHLAAPTGAGALLARSLPFKGSYFGAGFHHNYFTYGVAFLEREYTDEALGFFEEAISVNPSQAGAYYNAGIIYLGKNQLDPAKVNLSKAVELDPSDANAWNNLGVVYGEQENYDEAQKCFEKTIALRPYHLLALQNLVKLYQYRERPGDARRILEAAIASQPTDPQLHAEFGMFLIGQQQGAQAQNEFQRAVELDPRNASALNGLGVSYLRQGKTTEASEAFERCIQLEPEFDRPYLNLASIYLNGGDSKRALALLTGFLRTHPDNQEIAEAVKQIGGGK